MANNPKFTVLYEKLRGQTFEIDQESMSIGRKPEVDIQLKDGSVSSHHADIIRSSRDGEVVYILRDNDSTNGTKINGSPVTEQELKNSDLIMFGNVEVLFDGVPGKGENTDFSQMTHTIDISSADLSSGENKTLLNFNPMAAEEERKRVLIQKSLFVLYILLGIGAFILLFFVIINLAF